MCIRDRNQGSFSGEGLAVDGVRLVSTQKRNGDQIRLGIRPQHMWLDPNGPVTGTVTLVEQLGTETVLELITQQGTPFRIASPENVEVSAGQQASFNFEAYAAHLF